jgi:hypothetical protein
MLIHPCDRSIVVNGRHVRATQSPPSTDRSAGGSSKKSKKLLLILLPFPVFFFIPSRPVTGRHPVQRYSIHVHDKTLAVVKHLHAHATCLFSLLSRLVSSLHLCLCLIRPRSTLDQHRRLISPPATRQHSPSPKRTQLFPYLVPPSDTVRCTSVQLGRYSTVGMYAAWEHNRYD